MSSGRKSAGTGPAGVVSAFWRGLPMHENNKPSWLGKKYDPSKPSVRQQQSQYLRRNTSQNITLPKLKFMEGEDE